MEAAWLVAFAIGLLFAGVVAGVIAGLLGVGGGIVIVPVLFHVFTALGVDEAVRMHLAVGTSLATIIATSAVSARAHHARGAVDTKLLRHWGAAVGVGVLAGTAFGSQTRGAVLTLVFAAVALLVAAYMALGRQEAVLGRRLPSRPVQAALAAVIGAVSAMMGIGGGTLTVPVLAAYGYPLRRAVGTAAALGLIIGVPGAVGFVLGGLGVPDRPPGSLGYVSLPGLALIAPMTMLAAPLGARLAHTMRVGWLRLAFAGFLLLTSLRMFVSALG